MLLSQTLRLFLDSIGRSEEYEFYLKRFQSLSDDYFCLLVPDYQVIKEAGNTFLYQLDFVHQLGLQNAIYLSGPLAEKSAKLIADSSNLFSIHNGIKRKQEVTGIPVFVQADKMLGHLPSILQEYTKRFYFVRMNGALQKNSQPLLYFNPSDMNLHLDQESLAIASLATSLQSIIPKTQITITSPFELAKEIFTVKGAGTILRRASSIKEYPSIHDIDVERLLLLIGDSFGKRIVDSKRILNTTCIFLEENYAGAILLEKTPLGMYLSKFAVGTEARGAGLAQDLWQKASSAYPSIFWRARSSNSIKRWYTRIAEGCQKTESWTIFWVGVTPNQIPEIIHYCSERQADF